MREESRCALLATAMCSVYLLTHGVAKADLVNINFSGSGIYYDSVQSYNDVYRYPDSIPTGSGPTKNNISFSGNFVINPNIAPPFGTIYDPFIGDAYGGQNNSPSSWLSGTVSGGGITVGVPSETTTGFQQYGLKTNGGNNFSFDADIFSQGPVVSSNGSYVLRDSSAMQALLRNQTAESMPIATGSYSAQSVNFTAPEPPPSSDGSYSNNFSSARTIISGDPTNGMGTVEFQMIAGTITSMTVGHISTPIPMLHIDTQTSQNVIFSELVPAGQGFGSFDRSKVDTVAAAMGYDHFNWIQMFTTDIGGDPYTPGGCNSYFESYLSAFPTLCTDLQRGPVFDVDNNLKPAVPGDPSTFVYYPEPEQGRANSGTIGDAPCAPGGVTFNFVDFLVGIDQSGNPHLIGNSPFIDGPTGFRWQYQGDNSFFASPSACNAPVGTSSTAGLVFGNSNPLDGVGLSTFLGPTDFQSVDPEFRAALSNVGFDVQTSTSVPEPSSGSALLGAIGFLCFWRWRERKRRPVVSEGRG